MRPFGRTLLWSALAAAVFFGLRSVLEPRPRKTVVAGGPTPPGSPRAPWASEPAQPPPAPETLIHDAAVQTYEVIGKTWQDLSASVDAFGTQARGAPAKTRYSLAWHPGPPDGACGLSGGIAGAEVTVLLPSWPDMPNNTDEARQWWLHFIRPLALRQQRHVEEALDQAKAATQTMRASSCRTAEDDWKAVNQRAADAQRAYDAGNGNMEADFRFEPQDKILLLPETPAGSPLPAAKALDAGPGFPNPMARGAVPFDFSLPLQTLDGRPFSLEASRGKVVVLNFWATWCGFCRAEEPSFETLMQRVNAPSIVFAFATAESAATVKSFLEKSRWAVPVYLAASQAADPYERSGIPETLIVGKGGDVVMKVPGARRWDSPQMIDYLRALAAE